jgi:hypothetical protein
LSIQPLVITQELIKIAIETAKTSKVNMVVAVMSIFCKKRCMSQIANLGNKKPSHQKGVEENSCKPRNLSQNEKGQILKKLAPKSKKIELNSTNLRLNCKK